MRTYSYLALGDSYTIGEQVPIYDSFPYQAVQLLRMKGIDINAPEVIAKTGWTTDELSDAISRNKFLQEYDLVSLLIGVNNQYRGRIVENYKEEYEHLLQAAIKFAGNNRERVFVLSIPDWGVTPFAEGRDRAKIAAEIDAYNEACKVITQNHQCRYIDITGSQRHDAASPGFLTGDGLHPSGKEYAKWAKAFSEAVSFT
jgi:lysophospholipase L1-like esterase